MPKANVWEAIDKSREESIDSPQQQTINPSSSNQEGWLG